MSWPDGDATDEQWLGWLSKAWAGERVAEAVRLASPPLAGRIDAVCGGQRARMGDARRLAMPLARYLTRMRGRATPFGLFAGVAPLRSGPGPGTADLAVKGAVVRADAMWLADVIRQLESYAELLQHLPVVANDLATVRGGRLVVPWQPCGTGDVPLSAAEVAVRYSDAVRAAVEAARSPIQ